MTYFGHFLHVKLPVHGQKFSIIKEHAFIQKQAKGQF